MQQDASDCGVACLLSLIQYYGGESSLEKLRELSGTSKQGTTLLGLYQAANQLGFNAQGCEADIVALMKHDNPVILHVLIEQKLEYYIVCYGYESERFVIFDPLARLLVKNPKILLLDEPTAAMDRKMEKQTLDILKSIKEDRIIFFISHRLHILKNYADFIYLLDNGSISHAGTHQQMLQSENLYSEYWQDLLTD